MEEEKKEERRREREGVIGQRFEKRVAQEGLRMKKAQLREAKAA